MHSKDYIAWLEAQLEGEYFQRFMSAIHEQRQNYVAGAIQQGDTEFTKGGAATLKWVLDLPGMILNDFKQSQPPDDTTDTSGKET